MGQVTVARALATLLERMGTEYVFGVNGHGNWALLDAVVHETTITGIPARAEDQALQMADGYWRMRRQAPLAVVVTSVGPGNMNILPALATAFYESVALVVLAGGGSTHWFDRGGIEEAYRYAPEEWIQVVRPVSKKAVLVNRPDTAVDMFLRAYQAAITGRPGPVVLQIPFDVQHTPIDDRLPDPAPRLRVHQPAPDPGGGGAGGARPGPGARPAGGGGGGQRHRHRARGGRAARLRRDHGDTGGADADRQGRVSRDAPPLPRRHRPRGDRAGERGGPARRRGAGGGHAPLGHRP